MTETFALLQPSQTHWRDATCEEVGCVQWAHGWVILLDPADAKFRSLVRQIAVSGRQYREMSSEQAVGELGITAGPGLRAFVFSPGQRCFRVHRVPVGREPVYLQRRPNGRTITHPRWESWRDEFHECAFRARRLTNG